MSGLGVIGQKYEDRRTKKTGIMLERDEKYKTFLMQAENGNTFNISYGTFKSNWRTCGEPVVTIEEAMEEIEIPEEQPKYVEKKVPRRNTDNSGENVNALMEDVIVKAANIVSEVNDERITTCFNVKKKQVVVKYFRRRIVKLLVSNKDNHITVCSRDKFALYMKENTVFTDVLKRNSKNMDCAIMISGNDLDSFLAELKTYINVLLVDGAEELAKQEEE